MEASGRNAAAYDRPVSDTVILRTAAPALILRPWRTEDVPSLVEAHRDPVLRRWTGSAVEDHADAMRWVQAQERKWAAGERFGFAVLDPSAGASLVGNVVLKDVTPGEPSAEVGYWTAAYARGRGVAPRALEALTSWAFDAFGTGGLERLELLHQVDNAASCRVAEKSGYDFDRTLPPLPPGFPREGHLHVRRGDA